MTFGIRKCSLINLTSFPRLASKFQTDYSRYLSVRRSISSLYGPLVDTEVIRFSFFGSSSSSSSSSSSPFSSFSSYRSISKNSPLLINYGNLSLQTSRLINCPPRFFATKSNKDSTTGTAAEVTDTPHKNEEGLGFYNMPVHHDSHSGDEHGGEKVHHSEHSHGHEDDSHHSPRGHLWEDGTPHWKLSSDSFHWYDIYGGTPKQEKVDGKSESGEDVKMIKGVETRPLEELYSVSQFNVPFWPRTRLNYWGNNDLGLKAEFLFFWIPTMIIASLAIPCLTMVYMSDEAIFTTMTVKCIGRQWYWVYEVESPPEAEDEE